MEERIYTINIRKAILKVPRWERSKRAMSAVRNFLKRHMKGDEIRIGKSITEKIWKGGSQNPPNKIRIHAIRTEEGEGEEKKTVVKAELLGVPFIEVKEKKKEEKKPEEKGREEKTESKEEKKSSTSE
jgi:large subunit ribosomal protein L31e